MLLNTIQMSSSESKLKRREDLSILVKSTQKVRLPRVSCETTDLFKKATDEMDRLLSGFAADSVSKVLAKIS